VWTPRAPEHLLRQAELAEKDKLEKEEVFRRWAAKICPDGSYINARSVTQKRHLLFSSHVVEITKAVKHSKTKRQYQTGDVVELAYVDAQELIASKAARTVDREGASGAASDPQMKTFSVENREKLLEAGRSTPKATREISVRGLGLRPVAYTATGAASTSGAVISQLAGKPFADPPVYGTAFHDLGGGKAGKEACEALGALLEAESIDKLLSTFLRTLPKMADGNSRIHTALNLNTETGRLSSMRPNLQNQPALEKDVYGVRRAFSAQKGNKLIVVDYGQLELRIMAHMTRCKSMIEAFELGGDFHSRTAIDMYPHVKDAVDRQEVLLANIAARLRTRVDTRGRLSPLPFHARPSCSPAPAHGMRCVMRRCCWSGTRPTATRLRQCSRTNTALSAARRRPSTFPSRTARRRMGWPKTGACL